MPAYIFLFAYLASSLLALNTHDLACEVSESLVWVPSPEEKVPAVVRTQLTGYTSPYIYIQGV